MTRPGWDEWALPLARAVGKRGDCTRRQVGAVILDVNHRIAGSGYNGTYSGGPSCLKGECPRGRHYETTRHEWNGAGHCKVKVCGCGKNWPCPDAVPSGSSYDTGPGACIGSHAEQNAVADVDNRARLDGATMYVTCAPCDGCIRQLRNTTRIAMIKWPDGEMTLP